MNADDEVRALGTPPLLGNLFLRFTEEFYLLFRLVIAFLLALHGAQKAFLLWGFPADHELGVKADIAGWVEFFAAILIASGVFTRLGAGAIVVVMLFAFFDVHTGMNWWPHLGGGTLPLSLFAACGLIGVLGSRKYGIERLIFKRELL